MKRIRNLFVLVIVAVISMSFIACESTAKSGSIKVGVRESVPGFGYKNPKSGTYSGMEIELVNMLADALGYSEVEFVSVTAETREDGLKNGEVDFVVATVTITDERKEEFNFSAPYYNNQLRIMVQNSSNFTSLNNLKGMTIGVSKGSTASQRLATEMANKGIIPKFSSESFDVDSFQGGVKFKVMETYPELNIALEEGTIDAICSDRSILMGYLNDERNLLPEFFAEQGFGVFTVKDSKLSEKIYMQIEQWTNDGTIDQLHSKWDLK